MSAESANPADDCAVDAVVDGGPLGCGELLVLLHRQMCALPPGAVLEVVTADPGAREDLPAWCRLVGHTLLAAHGPHFFIRKGDAPPPYSGGKHSWQSS